MTVQRLLMVALGLCLACASKSESNVDASGGSNPSGGRAGIGGVSGAGGAAAGDGGVVGGQSGRAGGAGADAGTAGADAGTAGADGGTGGADGGTAGATGGFAGTDAGADSGASGGAGRGGDGLGCSVDADCDNGHCVSGVCCHTGCVGDACNVPNCSTGTCQTINVASCYQAGCQVAAMGCSAPDTDGDGLSDAWETSNDGQGNHFVDLDCNGNFDPGEPLLVGADANRPDIYVYYDWMDYGTDGNLCASAADCSVMGSAHAGELCDGGQCVYPCQDDGQCTGRGSSHVSEKCNLATGFCEHTHDPEIAAPGALAKVVAAFDARGFNLHLTRGSAKPHSLVTSFRTDDSISDDCEGGSLAAGNVGIGRYVVGFYDLKTTAPAFPPSTQGFQHYGVFAHYTTCDTDTVGTPHCRQCPATGKIPGPPSFGASGLAEIDGNDFMVTLGVAVQDRSVPLSANNLGGTFMHELGHNLGLRHGGGSDTFNDAEDTPTFKPNFISVMNYKYQIPGVQVATAIGGVVPNPALARLDYSTQALPTGGNTPGGLDENTTPGMDETAGLGSGTADLTSFDDGACAFGFQPTNGPVDYDGNGDTLGTNVSADLNRQDHPLVQLCPSGISQLLVGHAEWGPGACHSTAQACCGAAPCSGGGGQSIFTYQFQCTPMFADGVFVPSSIAGSELDSERAAAAHVLFPPLVAKIVVRRGCRPWIALASREQVPVTLFGDAAFDVSRIDLATVRFAGAPSVKTMISDVDRDGRPDLSAEFVMSALHLAVGATTATLTGSLVSSQLFVANGAIAVRR